MFEIVEQKEPSKQDDKLLGNGEQFRSKWNYFESQGLEINTLRSPPRINRLKLLLPI